MKTMSAAQTTSELNVSRDEDKDAIEKNVEKKGIVNKNKQKKAPSPVTLWLHKLELEQLKRCFASHGYVQMIDIMDITDDELKAEMMIEKRGIRTRILNAIKAIKEKEQRDVVDAHKLKQKLHRKEVGETEVSKWLKEKVCPTGAGGKMKEILDAFINYEMLSSLEFIDENMLSTMGIEPGYQTPIMKEIKKLFPKNYDAPKNTIVEVQSTLKNQLKLDDTDHGVRINSMTMSGGSGMVKAKYFSTLKPMQREHLLDNLNLFCGRDSSSDGVESKTWPIFELRDDYKSLDKHFVMDTKSSFVSFTTFDSQQTSLAINGYSNTSAGASASGGFWGCSAEASASASSSSTSAASGSVQKEMATDIVKGLYPRGWIELDERCLKLTKQFEEDLKTYRTVTVKGHKKVNDAVANDAVENDDEKRDDENFKLVFRERYGTWVNLKVHVGGKIYATQQRERSGDKSHAEEQEDFKAAVSAKVSSPYGGFSADASHGSGGGSETAAQHIHESSQIRIDSIGGENTSVSQTDWSKWQDSVASKFQTWAVIDVKKVCNVLSLIQFMDEPFKSNIKAWYDEVQDAQISHSTLWKDTVVHNYDVRALTNAGWERIVKKHFNSEEVTKGKDITNAVLHVSDSGTNSTYPMSNATNGVDGNYWCSDGKNNSDVWCIFNAEASLVSRVGIAQYTGYHSKKITVLTSSDIDNEEKCTMAIWTPIASQTISSPTSYNVLQIDGKHSRFIKLKFDDIVSSYATMASLRWYGQTSGGDDDITKSVEEEEIERIISKMPNNTKIFMGVAEAGNENNILIGAFGPLSVLKYNTDSLTTAFKPQTLLYKDYHVYWYNVKDHSFGFASSPTIDLENSKYTDVAKDGIDNDRVSWCAGTKGSDRAGVSRTAAMLVKVIYMAPVPEGFHLVQPTPIIHTLPPM